MWLMARVLSNCEAWVLSPAAYICGELGVVLQTWNADLVVMLGLGKYKYCDWFEASLGYFKK